MWWFIAGAVTVIVIQMIIAFITAPLIEDEESLKRKEESKSE